MVTITLPDAWALVAPCGCKDGICLAVFEGRILKADPAAAWKMFTPLKSDRDREAKQGYKIVGLYGDDARISADCPHEPKWGLPVKEQK